MLERKAKTDNKITLKSYSVEVLNDFISMELAHNSLLPLLNITEAQNKTAYTYPLITLVLSITSSSVSILGGTVIILTYITLPEIRNFTRKLVVSLTVADLLTAIGIWVSVIRYFNLHGEFVRNHHMEDTLCKIQSFLTTLSSLVSFFLTSIIAVYIFDTVIHQKDRLNKRRWLIAFNLVSWVIPGMYYSIHGFYTELSI